MNQRKIEPLCVSNGASRHFLSHCIATANQQSCRRVPMEIDELHDRSHGVSHISTYESRGHLLNQPSHQLVRHVEQQHVDAGIMAKEGRVADSGLGDDTFAVIECASPSCNSASIASRSSERVRVTRASTPFSLLPLL